MKVVHITPTYFDPTSIIGGGERYAMELAKAMSEIAETELISFSDRPRVEKAGSLIMRLLKPWFYIKGQKTTPFCPQFLSLIAGADIIHCYQYHTLTTSLSILFGKLLRKKVFVTDLGGGGWDILSYRVPMGNFIDGFIHISEYSKKIFSQYRTRHYVVYGGADTKKFFPLGLTREKKVLFVGRLLPHKGVNYLIDAIDNEIPLTIISTSFIPEYFEYLKKIAIGKKVEFITGCNNETLLREYNTASVLVLPSVYKTIYGKCTIAPELLGLVVLEAMACKTPVIVTDVDGLPEIVKDGETGFVVSPNNSSELRNKMYALINNPQEIHKMGEAAYNLFLEKFTWDKTVEKVLKAYQDAL